MKPISIANGIAAYLMAGIFLMMLVFKTPVDRDFLPEVRGDQPGFARFIEGTPWKSRQIEFGFREGQMRCVYSGALHRELGIAINAGRNISILCDRAASPPKVYEVVVDDTTIVDYQQTMREFGIDRLIGYAGLAVCLIGGTYITFFQRIKHNR